MTQVISWIVMAGKKEYKLTQDEYAYMMAENTQGNKTLIWFPKFTINLSFVTSMDRVIETVNDVPQLPDISKEQRAKNSVRLAEMKARFLKS